MKKRYTAEEMREMALVEESYRCDVVAKMLRQAADMMERESTREKSSQVGNEEAMREALEAIIDTIDKWRINDEIMYWQYSELFDIAYTALAIPPSNCDVGKECGQ